MLTEKGLTVNGTVTKEEFTTFGLYHFKKFHTITFYFLLVVVFLIFAIPTSTMVELDVYIYFIGLYGVISLVSSLLVLLIGRTAVKVRTSKEYKSDPLIQNKITYTFSENEIKQTFGRSAGYFEWSNLRSVHENKDMFRLYVSKSKAIILPKRFFDSSSEIDQFKKLLRDQVDERKVKFM
ncbi:YcxB family protein [Rossellomorea marisflavi]|uniref:YcxB family protein n=1 Tax=Rossellomorea marisflavi TaxID=189381 RepID=UPI002079B4BE|nr:YcxB family protein [Rossellomorea marisflavi]USK91834.1 YcxB family protein [Rossellomorea marisflavi]